MSTKRKNDKVIDDCLRWLRGEIAGDPVHYLFAIACLARQERELRAAAKAVLAAKDEPERVAAMAELRRALR